MPEPVSVALAGLPARSEDDPRAFRRTFRPDCVHRVRMTVSQRPRGGWGSLVVLAGAALLAIVFLGKAALPYLLLDPTALAPYASRRRVDPDAHRRRDGGPADRPGAVVAGSERPDDAGATGGSVVSTSPASASARPPRSISRPTPTTAGCSGPASQGWASPGSSPRRWPSRRFARGLVDQHREWMIRSYVVTFAFVVFRALFLSLQAADVGTLQEQLAACSWFCWAVPLVITEAVLQGRKIFGRRGSRDADLRISRRPA